ncbi:toxin-antitoxin system YwqK family antitoxin [uncultured Polaribacter sp.]|uniref:toxin-antitoxin system YwqK family antitoxin n=1 Tax=uncultured Polaribacter sp. TaxID=174711 RepID=UPI002618AC57|nr:toxin-antitoxin system YwqK family antitoxin [uncultured Polaribacter sp.]
MHFTNNILSFFLSILISLVLIQCKTINKKNNLENIKKPTLTTKQDKRFKEYYTSGELKTEGQHFENKKTGKWVSYYENGETKSIRNYKDGKLDGYQKMDYSQVLYMEGISKNGQKTGTWKSFLKENNQLKYLKKFDDFGNATGEWKGYYDSGELNFVENYLNNKPYGEQTKYFKNGNISSRGEKRNGKNDGIWEYYYDNGNILCEREFKNGVDNGKYVQYFKNGKIHKIGTYKNFKKVGTWKIYNEQSDLIETVKYEN